MSAINSMHWYILEQEHKENFNREEVLFLKKLNNAKKQEEIARDYAILRKPFADKIYNMEFIDNMIMMRWKYSGLRKIQRMAKKIKL